MSSSHKCRRLADEIERILAGGIPIDSRTRRFVTAMGEEPSPAFFARVFSEEADCETESLIELIFFPDEAVQMQLEALLEEECFDAANEAELIETLTERCPQARLLLLGEAASIMATVPSSAISAFVSRLHITNKLDALLIAAINSKTTLDNKAKLKVRLRNSTLAQTASEVDFLCLFFEGMKEPPAEFFPSFDFLLSFLGECRNETDYRSALLRMRQKYEQQKGRAEQFEHRLARSNMETIMLQGDRAPVIGAAQAREKIDKIDVLLHTLYNF